MRRLLRFISIAVLCFLALLSTPCLVTSISYVVTQYRVEETTGPDGQILYTHEDKETTDILNYIASGSSRDERLYKMVWAIEKVSGNPKVRFIDQKNPSSNPESTACYYASVNTMYINAPESHGAEASLGNFTAEASHALQYYDNPMRFLFMAYRDTLLILGRTLVDMIKSFSGFYTARRNEMYIIPGTIENEAHHTIEPKLKKYVSAP